MNKNLTNLITAATAASTALLASTVAMSTATAATFVYSGTAKLGGVGEQLTISSSTATTRSELFGEVANAAERWTVRVGTEELQAVKRRGSTRFYSYTYNLLWAYLSPSFLEVRGGGPSSIQVLDEWRSRGSQGAKDTSRISVASDWSIHQEILEQVPEPSGAIALLGLGAVGVASRLRRRSK